MTQPTQPASTSPPESSGRSSFFKLRYLVPLAIFLALAAFLYVGLGLKPREVPSPLIGKAAPAFQLPTLHQPDKVIAPADLRGKVWLFNVWASWCISCRQEHPVLMQMARSNQVPIYGLNYKDQRADGIGWLQQHGNPYVTSAFDLDGRVGIDYGVYGVPETFIIDKQGVIRHKVIGPLSPQNVSTCVMPIVHLLEKADGPNVVIPKEIEKACA